MSKIGNWLIHKLGGYTRNDWNGMMMQDKGLRVSATQTIHPQRIRAALSYYVSAEHPEDRPSQDQRTREVLAQKLAGEMLDASMIVFGKRVDPIQDKTPAYQRYRMTAEIWVVDAATMPMYGGIRNDAVLLRSGLPGCALEQAFPGVRLERISQDEDQITMDERLKGDAP